MPGLDGVELKQYDDFRIPCDGLVFVERTTLRGVAMFGLEGSA